VPAQNRTRAKSVEERVAVWAARAGCEAHAFILSPDI
jgi:hypothetical protein